MVKLGVNVDHIATLRQQRRGAVPDPLHGAIIAETAGADSIVAHLREDRRHIQDRDIRVLKEGLHIALSLEMGATPEMEAIALDLRPTRVCLVPEKRQELTTEGGLDVIAQRPKLKAMIGRLKAKGIEVSLFIDPDMDQILCAAALHADTIELHTGRYAEAAPGADQDKELTALTKAGDLALKHNLNLHAGHGLDYRNTVAVARIPGMQELNIGFAVVSRALFVGLDQAVREMKALIAV